MKLELKWVAIIFIIHVLWQVAERFLGIFDARASYHELSGLLFFGVYACLMFFAIVDLRKNNRGYLNKRHGFLSGLFISFVLVALSPVMVGILSLVIQPDFFNMMIIATTENGEYQAYEAAAQEYNYWSFVKLFMASYLLIGSLAAALWSFILHKMPEPAMD